MKFVLLYYLLKNKFGDFEKYFIKLNKLNSSYILTSQDVKNCGGTYYIELQNHTLDYDKDLGNYVYNFWEKESVYIHGYTWTQYFDVPAEECITNDDFLEIYNIYTDNIEKFSQKSLKIANYLSDVQHNKDLEKSHFYSTVLNCHYFRLLDEEIFNNSVQLDKFIKQILIIKKSFEELAKWLNQQNKGIVFIGN